MGIFNELQARGLIAQSTNMERVEELLNGDKPVTFYILSLIHIWGLSGFPKPYESEHDAFVAGHSSTSVSVALGMARARDYQGKKHKVVAVLGDGALTGGTVSYTHLDVYKRQPISAGFWRGSRPTASGWTSCWPSAPSAGSWSCLLYTSRCV